MTRLPISGQDNGTWGNLLNDFLGVSHNPDGSLQLSAIAGAGGYIRPSSGVPSTDLAGNIPATLLDTSTQTIISSVASKYVMPPSGITKTELSSGVQTSLTRADTSIQSGGIAGGDLGGTYPNPIVAKVNGIAVSGTPSASQVLTASSSTAAAWAAPPLTSDATTTTKGIVQLTGDLSGTATAPVLVNTGPGVTSVGDASHLPVVTIDAKGRVTALTSQAILLPESSVTNLTNDLSLKAPLASPTFTGITTVSGGSLSLSSTAPVHITSAQTTPPTVTAGTGAGTGPSALSVIGTDTKGIVSLTTGAAPTVSAPIVTITFDAAYASAPIVILTPANALTAGLTAAAAVYPTSTTLLFVINSNTTAITAAVTFAWNYLVIQ